MKSAFTITRRRTCLFVLALTALSTAYAARPNPQLARIQYIYLLPMSHGFDQYLANHLAQTGRFQIVTDPKVADAIFTDRLGAGFDATFSQLFPPPAPPKEHKEETASSEKKQSQLDAAKETIQQNEREEKQLRVSTFGHSKGNLFLVERHSRNVIWSQFKQPRNTQPNELDKLADYFAGQLKKQAGQPVTVVAAPPAAQPAVSTPPEPDTSAPVTP